ncbi:MAG TPA: hypothetical protein VKY85_05410 [Candidatus Angelobacter sp.]|nr:hypothetical protein [Candidatus Angelobacter sp.]
MANTKSILANAANVALIVVSCLFIWLFVIHRDALRFKAGSPPDLTGTVLSPPPTYNWSGHDRTLVMAIQLGCHFCEDSMPFYRQLSELQHQNKLHATLLAYMPNQAGPAAAMLQSEKLDIAGVFDRPLKSLSVTGTPTLLLVNAKGRVERSWIGELPPEQQLDVIKTLEK